MSTTLPIVLSPTYNENELATTKQFALTEEQTNAVVETLNATGLFSFPDGKDASNFVSLVFQKDCNGTGNLSAITN